MSRRRSNERLSESAAQRRAAEGSVRARPGERAREVELLTALRENQRLLRELAYAYRMPRHLACSPTSMSGVSAISCPHDVVKILGEEMSTLCQEQLRVVLLDTKNQLLGCELIYQGTLHSTSIRAAEVLRPAVLVNAPAVIVVHNHPSGDPAPSTEDLRATEHLMAAGELVDIEVLDHIVLGREGEYASIRERGLTTHGVRARAA